ncbi:MAG: hypothetical protein ACE15B_13370 [Bryobacteraceae bacterium]
MLLAGTLAAQPRSVEVFGRAGFMRMGGDESSLGTGAAYGGAVLVPITRRFAVDVDALTARAARELGGGSLETRRTLIHPALVFRWGNSRIYGFAGGGIGGEFTRSGPGSSDSGRLMVAKTGIVANPTGRLLLRADFYWSARYVLPNTGVTVGVGFRF